ncbi:hypothetical protein M3649_04310 [Ureibacillus chungkukjangi]|uniref:hypothetical protein n=1 Tax=Ureibacillus chungkukjangi TaxID=1202712 RepID=UPI00203E3BAA|nr:hypothetical protein [Ureibacillus chungkukjangi]MCM3387357.1 hypothetical protein [Ureibacillus chungkukjangi]
MKKMEFSKKILYVTFILAIVIFSYAMWIQYLIVTSGFIGDTSIVTTLLTVLGAEITAGTSFYYWKSRRENEIKLKATYGENYTSNEEEM